VETHVEQGEVVLSGWVDSILAKRVAGRIAHQVLGTTSVQNELEVRPVSRSDQAIRADIEANFDSDASFAGEKIGVVVRDGAVTLSGAVSAHPKRRRASALALRVAGVRSIANELEVSVAQARGDDAVRQDIVKRLASNAITRDQADRIEVSVQDGVVTLAGRVDRYGTLLEAFRIASYTDGVRRVENRLQVARQ
jgi:osmotically-inducible protein OsmY